MNVDAIQRFISRLMIRRGKRGFDTSSDYWLNRYARGANSGAGSYNHLASFKAGIINEFVKKHDVHSVIEFGCGDGNQLLLAKYPQYMGFDISRDAIRTCRRLFANDPSKRFSLSRNYRDERAELALSLDVIYHLVEDCIFDAHMRRLFGAATRYVAIYSSNTDDNSNNQAPHVRHRKFSTWVESRASAWHLLAHVPNPYPYDGNASLTSFADFYFYGRG